MIIIIKMISPNIIIVVIFGNAFVDMALFTPYLLKDRGVEVVQGYFIS